MFSIFELIDKKANKIELTPEELTYLIEGYTKDEIPDYQMSAFLMAVKINGATKKEIFKLVNLYIDSGKRITHDKNIFVVDKHSTGGVGDKVSLILAPLATSIGLKVGKLSGRGLGYTGGTVDKLEAIPGFDIEMPIDKFKKHVKEDGIAIIGQTKDLCIADKKIYSLRDATATVSSLGLITASIMSKKIASGANSILLDVKAGTGGFFKNDVNMTKDFAKLAIEIGKDQGRDTRVTITNMDQPLGYAIGNISEIIEAYNVLNGKGPQDVIDLITQQVGIMYNQTFKNESIEEGTKLALESLNNGKALETFNKWMKIQGVTEKVDFENMLKPKNIIEVKSEKDGFMDIIDCSGFGIVAMELGAGRKSKDDELDFHAGITLNIKQNDPVKKNDVIATLYTSKKHITDEIIEMFKSLYSIESKNPNKDTKVIIEYIK